jgi:heme-degrading monooxygenase HmoA
VLYYLRDQDRVRRDDRCTTRRGDISEEGARMAIGFVAIHYPHASHRQDFISRVQHAAAVLRSTPGCLGADCWVAVEGETVVSTAQWESEEAQASSFAAAQAAGVDFAYDEREERPREILRLVSP